MNNKDEFTTANSRQELINKGKDDIKLRITVKKTCKAAINDLEILLKRFDFTNGLKEKDLKFYRSRFLDAISLLDKLQLAWQKHDLVLKK